jgi:ribose transport system substrate-binding protein
MRRSTRIVPLVSIAALALGVTAFGSVGSATTVPGGGEATAPDGTEASGGGMIVAFIPSTTNTAIAEWARGAEERASELGYDITIIENNFDQAEQDTQVQQQLGAADESVVAYAWWPSDNEAGVASLQALYDSGVPVLQTNQLPYPGSEQFVLAYAGVNDTLNGEVAGQLVVEARDWLVDHGATLHSEGGNAVIVGFIAGYQAGIDRSAAAIPILEDAGIAILDEVQVGFDPATGYEGTKELIAAHRDEGIDLVYAHNSALAEGVIQALEEEGYTPGEDVMVVGGTCHGNLEYLEDGREFATGVQAIRLEGERTIETIDEYLTNGEVAEFFNFIPNPPAHSPVYTEENEIETVTVGDLSVEEICVY